MSSPDLPEGWVRCRLGDVIPYGKTDKSEPDEIAADAWVLELEDIEKDTSRVLQRVTFGERQSKSTKNRFEQGDVLYGKLRPYLNKVVRADRDGYCSTEIVPLRPPAELDAGFLFHWLKHPTFLEHVSASSHGMNMPRLGTDAGKSAPFVLASVPEQKRIANKLDALLARVDACRTRLDRVPALLKRFRQAVLEAAADGSLTEEWRLNHAREEAGETVVLANLAAKAALLERSPTLANKKSSLNSQPNTAYAFDIPATWAMSTWGAISEWITYGFTRPMPSAKAGVRLLTAKDVHPFRIRLEESSYTTPTAFAELSDKDRPNGGDLLVTKDGTIGRAALVRSDEQFCINQSVAVVWLRSTTMNRQYLELIANAPYTQRFVQEMSRGMAIQHLSITDFAQCVVPVPPIVEQAEIVRRAQSLFSLADSLEAKYEAARAQVDRLSPALLAKAFCGELVPQDPNDEPAEALLAHLRRDAPEHPPARKAGVRRAAKH